MTIHLLLAYSDAIFTARRNARIASAVLAMAIPSVCPSVCPSVRLSHAGIVSKRLYEHGALSRALSDGKMCLVFSKPKNIHEGQPLPPEILAQTDPPPPESSEF